MIASIERRFVFRPATQAQFWQEPPSELGVRDVWLTLPGGGSVHGWWVAPPGWTPAQGAVHYSHGNSGNVSHRAESLRRLSLSLGRGVFIYDYPGFGRSPGRPTEAGCYAAADAALAWLTREMGVPTGEVILFGTSLGGAMALETATRHPYRATVLVAAFTSVPDMAALRFPWLPRRWVRHRFDNLAKITRCPGRHFIAHGTADTYVPYRMGQALYAAAAEPRRFLPLEGYQHHHSPGPEFYSQLSSFISETAL